VILLLKGVDHSLWRQHHLPLAQVCQATCYTYSIYTESFLPHTDSTSTNAVALPHWLKLYHRQKLHELSKGAGPPNTALSAPAVNTAPPAAPEISLIRPSIPMDVDAPAISSSRPVDNIGSSIGEHRLPKPRQKQRAKAPHAQMVAGPSRVTPKSPMPPPDPSPPKREHPNTLPVTHIDPIPIEVSSDDDSDI